MKKVIEHPDRVLPNYPGSKLQPRGCEEAKAEQLYNEILTKQIYPLTGNKNTYMNDLERSGMRIRLG